MKLNFTLIIINLFFLVSCANDTKTSKISAIDNQKEPEIENEILPVYLSGKTDENNGFENFDLIDYSTLDNSRPKKNVIHLVHKDSLPKLYKIKKSQIMELMMWGEDDFYNTLVFVTPGDSIHLEVNNGKFEFLGKNAAHYNFYLKADPQRNNYSKLSYNGDLELYKNQVDQVYANSKKIFEEYQVEHNVSREFVNYVSNELKSEYLYNLSNPREKSKPGKPNYNSVNGLTETLKKIPAFRSDGVVDLSSYYGDISVEDFKRPDFVNNDYFKRSLISYIRQYFVNHEYLDYNEENLDAELKFVNENFTGEIADFARVKILSDYYNKGFGNDKISQEILLREIQQIEKTEAREDYKAVVRELKADLAYRLIKLPESVLSEKLISLEGDTLTFGEILDKGNKSNFINIWGRSYTGEQCVPCLEGFEKLSVNEDIDKLDRISISLEHDEDRWEKDVRSFQAYLNPREQFRSVAPPHKSMITTFFKMALPPKNAKIPRYMIIDNEGLVLYNDLPSTNDSILLKKVLTKINNQESTLESPQD